MKTIAQYLNENQLLINIVNSEINRGRNVYLVIVEGTNDTLLTSQPSIYGGIRVKDGISVIACEGKPNENSTYSKPIDEIHSPIKDIYRVRDNIKKIDIPVTLYQWVNNEMFVDDKIERYTKIGKWDLTK